MGIWNDLRGFRRVKRAPAEQQGLAFYSRGAFDWPHVGPLLQATLQEGLGATYVSSEPDDPGLSIDHPLLTTACVGAGAALSVFFRGVKTRAFITSLPDLGLANFKRAVHPCHYVFVPHSLVSIHMAYRGGAFDEFDEVFCAGPHHVRELARLETLHGLRPKQLFEFGYSKLDSLMRAHAGPGGSSQRAAQLRVLVAPSWGPRGLLEAHGIELIDVLLASNCSVHVRPHPETIRRWPDAIRDLRDRFSGNAAFRLEEVGAALAPLLEADIMISDWSGAAMEFAFSRELPVLFIDTPPKVNNPAYEAVGLEPLEAKIRSEIGRVIPLGCLADVPAALQELARTGPSLQTAIRAARSQWVYNPGNSATVGARRISQVLRQTRCDH